MVYSILVKLHKEVKMMKKILVLFTGGTIGSKTEDGVISVAGDGRFDLIKAYRNQFESDVKFEARQITNILSENMLYPHWERLAEIISLVDFDNYQGIIVTHGSDTLAYTSAFLGMYFRHIPIPMYIIASNKPIGEKGSNGLFNFAAAVDKIIEGRYAGVFTLYEKVYISTRLIPADTLLDRFQAYGEDGVHDYTVFKGIHEDFLLRKKERIFHKPIQFTNFIMKIDGYPGIDFSQYNPGEKTVAVLYNPYHSGTACTLEKYGEKYSICPFIKKCLRDEIKVYICGIKKSAAMYDTLKDIIDAGAIPLYNISDVAAYMKLLIAYNQKEYPVGDILKRNLYFEIVDESIK